MLRPFLMPLTPPRGEKYPCLGEDVDLLVLGQSTVFDDPKGSSVVLKRITGIRSRYRIEAQPVSSTPCKARGSH